MTSSTTAVLIVGAGPVGLALSGDLGWRGVKCSLVEKTANVTPLAKTAEEKIKTLRAWAEGRARRATSVTKLATVKTGRAIDL